MKSQLYLQETTRNSLKSEILSFVRIYLDKLLPVFKDIDSEADKFSKDFYEKYMNQPAFDENIDPASIAEHAFEQGIEHYSYLKLGEYNLTASWHAMLYQLWEQQVRMFLFREISHDFKFDFRAFCVRIEKIKKAFLFHDLNLESLDCWSKIDELRHLCNVIKHGPGPSADRLLEINPTLFRKESTWFDKKSKKYCIETNQKTLLEETLDINEISLQEYQDILLSFWDVIPERNYSKEFESNIYTKMLEEII